MKILPSSSVNIRNLYGQQIQGIQTDAQEMRAQQRAAAQDRVEISPDAREIQNAQDLAQELPDVRAEKVAKLQAQIAAGTYQPDSQAIADRMMQQAAGLPL